MVCQEFSILIRLGFFSLSISVGTHDSSMNKSSKQNKLSTPEMSSIRVLVNAYREAASYLSRSADELEQLI